ncbi:transmembrane protein 41B-like isoform X2 [Tubulanus polymorphus]|uniref:transmembrane protein 41B-like isoform X2 n=1 Tax=Tubulanus polymorphus TaxID=672921 RepID=UPI003DA6AC30
MASTNEVETDKKSQTRTRKNSTGTKLPPSPLGAEPRRPLPQIYDLPYSSLELSENEKSLIRESCHQTSTAEWQQCRSLPRPRTPAAIAESFFWRRSRSKGTDSPIAYTQLNSHASAGAGSTRRSLLCLGLIFIVSLLALFVVYLNFPKLSEEEKQYIRVPRDIEAAKQLGNILSRYKDQYYYQVLAGYFCSYIFLQTFAIPGSIFLSILSGFLFPFPLALFLVCLCSCLGASFCYMLSYLVGRRLVHKYIPDKITEWSKHVENHRQHLLNYIIFLRITPFLPNWFINIASPVINVPLVPFSFGTFLGVAPPSFVAIQAGTTLHKLTSSSDAISWTSMIVLGLFALVSLLPVVFKKTLQKKFE